MVSDVSPYWSEAECIAIDPKTGERLGASDYRTMERQWVLGIVDC